MPLSEEEQRVLAQLEQSLHESDPRLVSAMRRGPTGLLGRRKLILSVCGVLLGIFGLLSGAVFNQIWLGVLGFILMLVSSVSTLLIWRDRMIFEHADAIVEPVNMDWSKPDRASKDSFIDRLEERWKRRTESDDY